MIAHDLTPHELRFLITRTPSGVSAWKNIGWGDPLRPRPLRKPRVERDGVRITLACADGDATTTEIVRRVFEAEQRKHNKKQRAVEKGVATRACNRADMPRQAARDYIAQRLTPAGRCWCCGKKLTDSVSRARGIGRECYEEVLQIVASTIEAA